MYLNYNKGYCRNYSVLIFHLLFLSLLHFFFDKLSNIAPFAICTLQIYYYIN
jgi:hypothetical protein